MERQHYYYNDEKRIKIPIRAGDLATKQEGNNEYDDHHHHDEIIEKAKAPLIVPPPPPPPSSSSWIRLKDPRIVRVSKACGAGKDRHSKVCTVRGPRDRRVRLSVPTALQLFDLQEKLGLNQPSKVIDWLLEAAKHDINELPPLPPLNLSLIHHHAILSSRSHPSTHHHHSSNSFWKLVDPKEASPPHHHDHDNVIHDQDDEEEDLQVVHDQVLPRHHHPNVSSSLSSFGGFLNSTSMPIPLGYQQWQPNAASATTTDDHHDVSVSNNINNVLPLITSSSSSSPLPLSLSMSMMTSTSTNYNDHHSHFGNIMEFENINVVPRQMNNQVYHHHNDHMLALTTSTSTTPSLYTSMMGMASHDDSQNLKPFGLRMITPNTTTTSTPTRGFPFK